MWTWFFTLQVRTVIFWQTEKKMRRKQMVIFISQCQEAREKKNLLLFFFIDKWLQQEREGAGGERAGESGHDASLYHPNNSISLREAFRLQTSPAGFSSAPFCQALKAGAAKHRIIHCSTALALFFPPSVERSHWQADGQMEMDSFSQDHS